MKKLIRFRIECFLKLSPSHPKYFMRFLNCIPPYHNITSQHIYCTSQATFSVSSIWMNSKIFSSILIHSFATNGLVIPSKIRRFCFINLSKASFIALGLPSYTACSGGGCCGSTTSCCGCLPYGCGTLA